MKKSTHKPAKPRKTPVTIILPPRDYQPSKAEHKAEVVMPAASLKTVGEAFFRPVKVKVRVVKKPTR